MSSKPIYRDVVRLDQLFERLLLVGQQHPPKVSPQVSPLHPSSAPHIQSETAAEVALQHMSIHDSVDCCVCYSWDGQYFSTACNRAAYAFDANTGHKVATFSDNTALPHEGTHNDCYVRAVCFSPDGNSVITGGEDHVVKVWDAHTGNIKHRLVGHETDISSVGASANNRYIVSGSGDNGFILWSLETGNQFCTLGADVGSVVGITSVSVSPNCQHVAVGSLDAVVRVWDVEKQSLVRIFEGHTQPVYSVEFSPDGMMLLSGSLDGTVKLWHLAASTPSSQCVLTLKGHTDFVRSVAFSPDGRWLISGSKDRTVRLWDARKPAINLALQGQGHSVISVAHNPTSASFATGCGDSRARTWLYSLSPRY